MRVVPRQVGKKISFYQTRLPKWEEDPSSIGSSEDEIAEQLNRTNAAREAYFAQRLALNAARSATQKLKQALAAMEVGGASIIGRVRCKAAMEGDGVYTLAQLPVPSQASPIGKPGQPSQFEFDVDALGRLNLKWKCTNPRGAVGTIYQVHRRIVGTDAGYVFLGISGKKKFTDDTLPAGTACVFYKIIAARSTAVGDAAVFDVNLGVSGPIAELFRPKGADKAAA